MIYSVTHVNDTFSDLSSSKNTLSIHFRCLYRDENNLDIKLQFSLIKLLVTVFTHQSVTILMIDNIVVSRLLSSTPTAKTSFLYVCKLQIYCTSTENAFAPECLSQLIELSVKPTPYIFHRLCILLYYFYLNAEHNVVYATIFPSCKVHYLWFIPSIDGFIPFNNQFVNYTINPSSNRIM